ncbi:DUF6745 domain-containing protein [Microcoleus sp. B9-D4]|uniref:DUF6745 domain-containing protein n=1 Tax=Microcoleus sp. B9-D4 TaxID=2818711 RepID=UPI002FD0BA66
MQAVEPLRIRDYGLGMASEIRNKIHNELYDILRSQLDRKLENKIYSQLYNPLYAQLMNQLHLHVKDEVYVKLGRKLGGRFQMENCGWIYPFEKMCFVCDRPIQLHFDNEYLLHALCQPAVEFADKFSLYSYRGVRLPEIIGQIPPQSWQASWLLTEQNAEVRRVLIQAIGYPRICQELQATELDTWQEYTLLKIENNIDIEPIYLLKMTCPSTGHLHALRVPPKVRSSSRASLTAKEAISWVNWGIYPEEFQVQT